MWLIAVHSAIFCGVWVIGVFDVADAAGMVHCFAASYLLSGECCERKEGKRCFTMPPDCRIIMSWKRR